MSGAFLKASTSPAPTRSPIYDDGVGTSEFKPLAVIGGAFGYGLKRNVLDLYKFACRNVRHDTDEIYAFGFSRGAFTIRILTGLILEQGLIRAGTEQELDHKARQAYREFRATNFSTKWPYYLRPEVWARGSATCSSPTAIQSDDNRQVKNIRFVGLWDSVAAYGLPIDEMTRGVSQWIWPWQLPNCVLNDRVQRACHALSIDDERTTFHPILWDERTEAPLQPEAGRRPADCQGTDQPGLVCRRAFQCRRRLSRMTRSRKFR